MGDIPSAEGKGMGDIPSEEGKGMGDTPSAEGKGQGWQLNRLLKTRGKLWEFKLNNEKAPTQLLCVRAFLVY